MNFPTFEIIFHFHLVVVVLMNKLNALLDIFIIDDV